MQWFSGMVGVISLGLAIFWGLYFTLAGSANLADALKHRGLLSNVRFNSGNYSLLLKVTSRYGMGPRSVGLIFTCLFLWELTTAASFWLASLSMLVFNSLQLINAAYAVGMSFFAALTIGNELFVFYESEGEHISILAALLLSLLATHLL